jgi:hypothetical protein
MSENDYFRWIDVRHSPELRALGFLHLRVDKKSGDAVLVHASSYQFPMELHADGHYRGIVGFRCS